ncbi:MAG: fold metallo-hydrolase [Marmoricola sp.]|nr:fold metallo-hydrolase [Marmoricola sp.]
MTRSPAIELAPNVWRIPTQGKDYINSFAFVDDDGVTLVDCGLKKAPPKIVAGLAAIGKQPSDVTRIVLTHVHPDHAGGAAEMARRTGAPVLIHQGADRDWAIGGEVIGGTDTSSLSGKIFARLGNGRFEAFQPGPALSDDEVLPVAGGLRVVHTPGHSPGHISLLHEETGTMITGDALFNFTFMRGLRISPKFLCSDFAMTRQTAHKLAELDYAVAAFTHGPEITESPREQIRTFLRTI